MSIMETVHRTLVTRLENDAGVGAIVDDRIYDGKAEDGAAFPHIVIGSATELPETMLESRQGWDGTVMIHLWASNELGRLPVTGLLAAVNAALAEPLVLDDYTAATLDLEFAEVLIDETRPADPRRHLPARYRIGAFEIEVLEIE